MAVIRERRDRQKRREWEQVVKIAVQYYVLTGRKIRITWGDHGHWEMGLAE